MTEQARSEIHQKACEEGKEHYRDPVTGYLVFTSLALKKRGYCCNSGCRHCPYNVESQANDERASWLTDSRPAPEEAVVILFWSGGKDSYLAYNALVKNDERAVMLLTSFDAGSGVIAHQDIHIDVVVRQAEHLAVPLIGVPLSPAREYIDHLLPALQLVDNCDAIAFGDLHLEHIRDWRTKTFAGHEQTRNLQLLFPIWHVPYETLLEELKQSGARYLVSAVTKPGLGINIGDCYDEKLVSRLPEGVDLMGEEGEFHTQVCFE